MSIEVFTNQAPYLPNGNQSEVVQLSIQFGIWLCEAISAS
jgi:hypothetical protein